ncbi:hypothetical protein D3C72_2234360 [compost metagenome]
MLGGIPWAVMAKAVGALEGVNAEIYRTFMAVQRRSPLDTIQLIADRLSIGKATVYRHLREALDYVDWYLDSESAGWPEGTKVS